MWSGPSSIVADKPVKKKRLCCKRTSALTPIIGFGQIGLRKSWSWEIA
jgi:hypothetical protein